MTQDEPADEPADQHRQRPDLWLPPAAGPPSSQPGGGEPVGAEPVGQPPAALGTWPTPPPYGAPGPRAQPTWFGPAPFRPSPFRPSAQARRSTALGSFLRLGVAAVALVLLTVGIAVSGGSPDEPGRTVPSSGPRPGTVPTAWSLDPATLRPDLGGARFLGSLDGSFQPSYATAVGGSWLTVTATEKAAGTVLHAIDPSTGAVRWRRDLDGVLCTTEAPSAGLLCASVLERDPTTGLGTRWRLHLLDPATGEDRVTRDVDGWLTAVHWTGSTFVVVEQREPAPHAVLRGFAPEDLRARWTRDLAAEPGQDEMFTEDRVVLRPEPERPGLALDRPRIRDVGDGLVALWAGGRTAFVDAASGRLVMMPHCSRLVDDGERLWCNEVDGATAYSYAGRRLVRVTGPRLAFPSDDGVGVDHDRAVFLNDDGAAVSVDPKTGAVGAAWTPPGNGSAFGQTTEPSTENVGDHTFLVGEAGTMLLDPDADRVVWRNPAIKISDVPVMIGDDVLLGAGRLDRVDLASGASLAQLRVQELYAVGVGDELAGVGPERISLLRP